MVIYSGEERIFLLELILKRTSHLDQVSEAWRSNVGKPAVMSFLEINQITIAAVNGFCLGGAACFVSAC